MAGKYSVETVFKAIDRMSAPIARMERRIQGFSDRVGRRLQTIGAGPKALLGGMQDVATKVAAIGAGAALVMQDVVDTGADFEQSLVNATVKFDGAVRKGTPVFERMRREAKAIGDTTEFAAQDAANALGFLAAAGFTAEQSIVALPKVIDLATAAELELGDAGNMAADALGAFGLFAKDSTQLARNLSRVSDTLAKGADLSNVSMQDLYETARNAAPSFTSAGIAVETFTAMASVMAKAGVKGADAGTALKNSIVRLSAPPTEAAKALRKLGIVTTNAAGALRDPVGIIRDLQKAFTSISKTEATGAMADIFGLYALPGMSALINEGADEIIRFRSEIEKAGGATAQKAGVMRDTTRGMINQVTNAFKNLKIEAFEAMQVPLDSILRKTREWVKANKEVVATNVGSAVRSFTENLPAIVTWTKRVGIAAGALAAWSAVTVVGIDVFLTFKGAVALWCGAVKVMTGLYRTVTYLQGAWTVANYLTAGSLGAVAAAALPVVAAVVAIALAVREFIKLLDLLEGYSSWELLKDFATGEWEMGFQKLDEHQNKLAKQRAEERKLAADKASKGGITAAMDAPELDAKLKALGDLGSKASDDKTQATLEGLNAMLEKHGFAPVGVGTLAEPEPEAPGAASPATVAGAVSLAGIQLPPQKIVTSGEITIKDETGRAKVTKEPPKGGVPLKLKPSGAF